MTKITISIREAIQLSGLGKTFIYKLIRTGRLKPRKIGNRTLLVHDEFDAFLRALPLSKAGKPQPPGHRNSQAEMAAPTTTAKT
jgi:excisionase family DNA binding protein